MSRLGFLLALSALTASIGGSAIARPEGVQVTPVIVEMPVDRGMTSVRIHNWRTRDVAFETDILKWSQEDGADMLTPASDMIVAPSVFSIPGGGEQIVRLALKPSARGGKKERAYRLILRELPDEAPNADGLRVQLQMSLPVFAGPKDAAPRLVAARTISAEGVSLINSGSSRVRLVSATADGQVMPVGMPRYLLAGSRAVWPRPAAIRALQIEYISRNAAGPVSENFAIDAPNASAGLH